MRVRLLFTFILFLTVSISFAQQSALQGLDEVVTRLHNYTSNRPQEKVHIHFDRPFYSVGDTVWFKAYVVNAQGNRLSALSKVLHVDLSAPSGREHRLLLPIVAGTATGQLVLGDSLFRSGNYQLMAYTQIMRAGPGAFAFSHTLRIIDGLPVDGNVSASFKRVSNGLEAVLIYRDGNGQPITSQEVTYRLKRGDKLFSEGKALTDPSGRMGVVFPQGNLPDSIGLVLEARAKLPAGPQLENRFIVDAGERGLSLDFFPESGALVSGIRSKVGFKAVGSNGMGVSIKGYIETQAGEKVSVFETSHRGMGAFALLPRASEVYTAVIEEGIYKGKRFELPKTQSTGAVLVANRLDAQTLRVRIATSSDLDSYSELRLVVQANGGVVQALNLPLSGRSVSLDLKDSQLANGINQLTLFSPDNRPLAERLVFVYKGEQGSSNLESDRLIYGIRDRVRLGIEVLDTSNVGAVGSYSVAVVHLEKDPLGEDRQQLGIYGNLLLSSDLKGHIEDPSYYFNAYDNKKGAELDLLMLTQGWRRFNWRSVLSASGVPPLNLREGIQVGGTVTDVGGKPVPQAKVKLLAPKAFLLLDTVADAQGRFSFNDLELADSAIVILRASGAKQSSKVRITLDSEDRQIKILKEQLPQPPLRADTVIRGDEATGLVLPNAIKSTGKIVQGTTLKEVEIFTKRKVPEIKGSVYPFAAAPPDYTFEPDKLQEMVNLETHLKGLAGVIVKGTKIYGRYKGVEGPMVLLLNGAQIEDLSGVNPRALKGVQIIKGGVVALNMAEGLMISPSVSQYEQNSKFGIVFLTMGEIDAKYLKVDRPLGFLQTAVTGYTYAREFYSPRYEVQKAEPKSDVRPTLFWKPDLVTGEDGKAAVDFFTSDEIGRYKITLEGITSNGQITRKTGYFTVK